MTSNDGVIRHQYWFSTPYDHGLVPYKKNLRINPDILTVS
jgi:hypothetical protein